MINPFEQYPVIEFKDIRKGDTVATVALTSDGRYSNSCIAIAGKLVTKSGNTRRWETEKGSWVVAWDEGGSTFYLLDRPKPVLPTTAGAIIYITEFKGEKLVHPVLAMHDGTKGITQWMVPGGLEHKVIRDQWPLESEITGWTRAELKEVCL